MDRNSKYKAHVLNLRELENALIHFNRQLNYAVASNNPVAEKAFMKIYLLIIGAWAEVRLLKVLFERNSFDNDKINQIMEERTLFLKWKKAVYLGFCKKYNVRGELTEGKIGFDAFSKYEKIQKLLDEDLEPLIAIRNNLAHGQWARTFNGALSEISETRMQLLNLENPLSCKAKKITIECMANIINDLVVGGAAFERDFNKHCNQLFNSSNRLRMQSYEKWKDNQIRKFKDRQTTPN